MMPDLGPYATEVTLAYVVSLVLLVAIVWISFRRAARIKAALERVEGQVRPADKSGMAGDA